MKLITLLLVVLTIGISGCQDSNVRDVKNIDYSRIAGRWKAEKFVWEVVISKDGLVESAVFPLGTVRVIPNKTVYLEMKDGGFSSYECGDFPLDYLPESGELQVTIKVKKIHMKYLDNEIKGSNEAVIVGPVSEDGTEWDAVLIEEFDYGPRFPQMGIRPQVMKFIKINN